MDGTEEHLVSRYHAEVEPGGTNNPHSIALRMVGPGRRVLELGASSGHVTKALVEQNCRVTAVEYDSEAAVGLEGVAHDVVVGDLNDPKTLTDLSGPFEVVLAGDVLEHLIDPKRVLRQAVELLEPDGRVVVSLPNIAHIDVRLGLLRGRFDYGPLGLLDETHIRFFTLETIKDLVGSAGLTIVDLERVLIPAFETELDIDRASVSTDLLNEILEDPEAETYQFVFTAVRGEAPGEAADLDSSAPRYAQNRIAELQQAADDTDRRIRDLERELSELRMVESPAWQRLISRYRRGIERAAPRGTRRRVLYERAMGREPVVPAPDEAPSGPVRLSSSAAPLLSIVVPVHGKWEYTRACLLSIEEHRPSVPFEVLVVDDDSPDRTAELVAGSEGVRLVRTDRNLGFIGACNLGAGQARGGYLLFLNNDTEVRPGALDAMVDAADSDDGIGLVGATLVYPDGRLQESGGIVWADGSGWNYGRGEDPGSPEFGVRRDVDYCSGAAILVRRDLFEQVGGFDGRFAPAYYEDTDLAFAIRETGHRTIVEPRAVVMHHEGVSNGTDLTAGIKRYQELNRSKFVDKWAPALVDQLPAPSDTNLWLARQRGQAGHRGGLVLVADQMVPTPDRDSGSMRMQRLLTMLVELGQRVVFFPDRYGLRQPYAGHLQSHGITVISGTAAQEEFLRAAGPALSLAVLSRPQVSWKLLEQLRGHAPQCLVSYDTVDLHFVRLGREAELAAEAGDTQAAKALAGKATASRELELGLMRATDLTLVVSETEQALLRDLVPDVDVRVLSNIHLPFPDPIPGPEGRSGLLFVGNFDHTPNRDAVEWMVRDVLPLVRLRHPDAVFHIAGNNPTPEVHGLAGPNVKVHGWVPDLGLLYRQCRISVAPLRAGAGVKGKVGESLIVGLPTVCTPVAVEGMGLVDGQHVLVGADAQAFADQVTRLLDDDALWLTLSSAGPLAITDRFGPEAARSTVQDIVDAAEKFTAGL